MTLLLSSGLLEGSLADGCHPARVRHCRAVLFRIGHCGPLPPPATHWSRRLRPGAWRRRLLPVLVFALQLAVPAPVLFLRGRDRQAVAGQGVHHRGNSGTLPLLKVRKWVDLYFHVFTSFFHTSLIFFFFLFGFLFSLCAAFKSMTSWVVGCDLVRTQQYFFVSW